jgi:hypothetical protein
LSRNSAQLADPARRCASANESGDFWLNSRTLIELIFCGGAEAEFDQRPLNSQRTPLRLMVAKESRIQHGMLMLLMKSSTYWKAVLVDRDNLLDRVLDLLKDLKVRYCVIGGAGVNAYTYPVVTEDLDIVVAVEDMAAVEAALGRDFRVRRFPHSINITSPPAKLQIQIQTDPRYFDYVSRAETRDVMDYQLPVARIEDILQGKVWAALNAGRRQSKRQKDLADIARILEVSPELRSRVPDELLAKLL